MNMDRNFLKIVCILTDFSLSHWKTNQVVTVDTHFNVPDPRHHTTRFHRGHLHSALLQHVPKDSIHLNKKVASAAATDDKVTLYFEDGSEAHGDLLIGADGIKSVCLVSVAHKSSFANLFFTKQRGLDRLFSHSISSSLVAKFSPDQPSMPH